jgi:hypothetical protein
MTMTFAPKYRCANSFFRTREYELKISPDYLFVEGYRTAIEYLNAASIRAIHAEIR